MAGAENCKPGVSPKHSKPPLLPDIPRLIKNVNYYKGVWPKHRYVSM